MSLWSCYLKQLLGNFFFVLAKIASEPVDAHSSNYRSFNHGLEWPQNRLIPCATSDLDDAECSRFDPLPVLGFQSLNRFQLLRITLMHLWMVRLASKRTIESTLTFLVRRWSTSSCGKTMNVKNEFHLMERFEANSKELICKNDKQSRQSSCHR